MSDPDPPFRRHWEDHPESAADAARRSWANTTDRTARTAPARAAQERQFLDEVDPDRILPADERIRRADLAKREYFRALSRLSARRRRLNRKDQPGGEDRVA